MLTTKRLSIWVMFVLLVAIPLLTFPYNALAMAPSQTGSCTMDRPQYSAGQAVTFICRVSANGYYHMIIYFPDGTASYNDWGYLYAGTTYYVSGVAGYPAGLRTAILYSSSGNPVATCYYSVGVPFPPGCPPNCPPIPPVTVTTTSIIPFDFKISVANPTAIIQAGGQASYTITVTTLSGTPQTVALEVVGVPSGASPNLNPASDRPSPTFSSVLTINTDPRIAEGTYTISINAAGGGVSRSAQVTLAVQGLSGTTTTTPSCGLNQHYDSEQGKCVDNATPPSTIPWDYALIAILVVAVVAIAFVAFRRGSGVKGAVAPGTAAWGPPTPPSAPVPQPPRSGLVCPSCGFVNRSTARYCVRDRTPLNPSKTSTYTPTRRK